MSLIQEALRRQQEDMDENAGVPAAPGTPAVPAPDPKSAPKIARKAPVEIAPPDMDTSAPPPVQEPPKLEEEAPPPEDAVADSAESGDGAPPPVPNAAAKEGKPGMKLALIALGAILCLAVGVWVVTFAIQKFMTPTTTETPADPAPAGGSNTTAPTAPIAIPDDPTPAEPTPTEPEPVVATPPPVATPAEPTPALKEPTIWPILVINGLVGKGAQGAVMINSQIIGVDETIEGVRVVSIDKQGCKLEYEGETKSIKVGGSTE